LKAEVEVVDTAGEGSVDAAKVASMLNDINAVAAAPALRSSLPNLTPASIERSEFAAPPVQPSPPPSSPPPTPSPSPGLSSTGGQQRVNEGGNNDDDALVAVAIAVPLGVIALFLICLATPLCYWYFNPEKRPAFMRGPTHYGSTADFSDTSASAAGKSFVPTTPSGAKPSGSPGATPGAEVYDVQVEVVDKP